MEESYSRTERTNPPDTSLERVNCTAVYSNFRHFETAVRILPSRN